MDIHKVALLTSSSDTVTLAYAYDKKRIRIKLDKTYDKSQNYTVYIQYTSRPEDLEVGGSAAITEDKGLYFINADGQDTEKPMQIWTQGETESNSVWFPTLEDPQQRMTQEISITVDTVYKTLSNGLLIHSVKKYRRNPDGYLEADITLSALSHDDLRRRFCRGEGSLAQFGSRLLSRACL
jgi:aminopeptidase N